PGRQLGAVRRQPGLHPLVLRRLAVREPLRHLDGGPATRVGQQVPRLTEAGGQQQPPVAAADPLAQEGHELPRPVTGQPFRLGHRASLLAEDEVLDPAAADVLGGLLRMLAGRLPHCAVWAVTASCPYGPFLTPTGASLSRFRVGIATKSCLESKDVG